MKVLHIEAGRHLYGGAQQVVYLMQGLQAHSVASVLVCPEGSEVGIAAERYGEVAYTAMRGDLDLGLVARLKKLIKEHQPDLVHVHSRRGADVFGPWAANSLKVPVICSRRVDNPEPAWFARWKYSWFDHVITISNGIRDVLLSEGLRPEHVTTVHSSVDIEKFTETPDRAWLNAEFGVNPSDIVFANFAQMIERKGQRMLIEGFHRLLKENPNAKLLLFGKGPKAEEYQQLVKDKKLDAHIRFPGFRTEMPKIMASVDFVVHPASMEGLGVALLQSAASRKAIVATAAGGIPEIVHHHQNGFLLSVGDAEGVIDAISQLCQSADLRAQYGEEGRRIVEQHFSIPAMAKGNVEIYRQVLANRANAK